MNEQVAESHLKELGLDLFDISIDFRTAVRRFEIEVGHCELDSFTAKFIVDESDDGLGYATFMVAHADQMHIADIRGAADGVEFSLYEAVSSVRIFEDEDHAVAEEMWDYRDFNECETPNYIREAKEKMAIVKLAGLSPYPEGFEQFTFEGKAYHEQTVDVWGKILILNDIEFDPLINNPVITEVLTKQLFDSLKYLGYFDWVIVNPNIDAEYLIENNYPASNSEEYGQLLEKLGFSKTYGKLASDRLCCYCMRLR